jgi:hypothetical protein
MPNNRVSVCEGEEALREEGMCLPDCLRILLSQLQGSFYFEVPWNKNQIVYKLSVPGIAQMGRQNFTFRNTSNKHFSSTRMKAVA